MRVKRKVFVRWVVVSFSVKIHLLCRKSYSLVLIKTSCSIKSEIFMTMSVLIILLVTRRTMANRRKNSSELYLTNKIHESTIRRKMFNVFNFSRHIARMFYSINKSLFPKRFPFLSIPLYSRNSIKTYLLELFLIMKFFLDNIFEF